MNLRYSRTIPAATLAAFLLSACGLIPGQPPAPGGVTEAAPASEATRDLSQPDGVALTFLDAWMAEDYEAMYSLLSPNSQSEYSIEEFTSSYTTANQVMGLQRLEVAPRAVAETTSNAAQFDLLATYYTRSLGPIEQELTMLLARNESSWGIAWSPALIFPELAGGNTLQIAIERPARANIYDRNGLALVSANAAAITLTVVPGEVSTEFEDEMVAMLADMTRLSADTIRQQYQGLPADWVVAIGDVDLETFNEYRTRYYSYPGLDAYEKTGRRYFNVLAPHVVGYARQIPAEELAAYQELGYQGDEIVGLSGLELWGEEYLAGRPSASLSAFTPSGQFFAEIASVEAEPAQSVYSTIDRELQAIVQDALEDAYSYSELTWGTTARGAAVVVMDVNTGDVLAMASYPVYDPNVLYTGNQHPLATQEYIGGLFTDTLSPLLNRATQGEYPPGSVFKIVTMATALDFEILPDDWTFTSTGVWTTLGTERLDWKEGGHGEMTLSQALTSSCNSCFYEIGYLLGQEDPFMMSRDAESFGFGRELGIAIAERPGLIPDPDWVLANRGRAWDLNDSVNMAIGQGDVLVTPLQMATMVSAIANGGTVYRPQLVDRVGLIGEEPSVVIEAEAIGAIDLTEAQFNQIREAMHEVTVNQQIGTAEYRLGSLSEVFPVAGKTGTAQVSQPGIAPNAWFAGFAPYDDPEIAIVVLVENGGQGSGVASPIFRRIVEEWYGLSVLRYPPDWADPNLFDFVEDFEIPGE